MGGMFTVMKIREGMARDDYSDPAPYRHPERTVAYEVDAASTAAPSQKNKKPGGKPPKDTTGMKPIRGMDMKGM
jgi:hypothetical protein